MSSSGGRATEFDRPLARVRDEERPRAGVVLREVERPRADGARLVVGGAGDVSRELDFARCSDDSSWPEALETVDPERTRILLREARLFTLPSGSSTVSSSGGFTARPDALSSRFTEAPRLLGHIRTMNVASETHSP